MPHVSHMELALSLAPTSTFFIDFDTQEMPGKIVATRVTLERVIVSDESVSFRVDLADHPLYPKLERYVSAGKMARFAGLVTQLSRK